MVRDSFSRVRLSVPQASFRCPSARFVHRSGAVQASRAVDGTNQWSWRRQASLPCFVIATLALWAAPATAQVVDTRLWVTNGAVGAIVRDDARRPLSAGASDGTLTSNESVALRISLSPEQGVFDACVRIFVGGLHGSQFESFGTALLDCRSTNDRCVTPRVRLP